MRNSIDLQRNVRCQSAKDALYQTALRADLNFETCDVVSFENHSVTKAKH